MRTFDAVIKLGRVEDEQWLPVPGYDNYEVSNVGRIRSLDRVALSRWGTPKSVRGKVLKQSSQGRYLVVTLYRDGQPKSLSVHRLVLFAFVGPCPEGCEALHFDDDPTNNRLDNLRWGSPSENSADCIRNGLHPKVNISHCPRGHEYAAADNAYVIPSSGHRQCRACIREKQARAKTRPHPRDRTHCPQGHAYTQDNTYRISGRRVCRACSLIKAKEYARRKKLRRAQDA